MNPVFYGTVRKGMLAVNRADVFKTYLLQFDGKPVAISVKTAAKTKPRSLNENNYYWGVVIPLIGQSTGYLPEEVHESLKHKFLRIHGDKLDRIGSTAVLDTIDFEKYLETVRMWAAQELQTIIPLPNEVEA